MTHPLIAALVVPASLLWARRHGTKAASPDVFLLLALLFLARCVLDAANNGYYHLPFLMALAAWETLRRERPPVLTAVATGAVWLSVGVVRDWATPDVQCAIYLAWTLPVLVALAYATFRLPRAAYATSRSATTATSATSAPAAA